MRDPRPLDGDQRDRSEDEKTDHDQLGDEPDGSAPAIALPEAAVVAVAVSRGQSHHPVVGCPPDSRSPVGAPLDPLVFGPSVCLSRGPVKDARRPRPTLWASGSLL